MHKQLARLDAVLRRYTEQMRLGVSFSASQGNERLFTDYKGFESGDLKFDVYRPAGARLEPGRPTRAHPGPRQQVTGRHPLAAGTGRLP